MSGILAVIPARAGSKGIPGKNLKILNGLSLTARAVLTALNTPTINKVVVSTDSEEIAAEALKYGAEVPFLRPAELSGDLANSKDMWRHAWSQSENYFGQDFPCSILLEPTSPFRTTQDVTKTLSALANSNDILSAATVSLTPAHYTPQKTLCLDSRNIISFFMKDGAQHSLRQSIPAYYHRNGICYALLRRTLFEKISIIEDQCQAIVINRPVVNIDTMEDFEFAEFLVNKQGEPLDANVYEAACNA